MPFRIKKDQCYLCSEKIWEKFRVEHPYEDNFNRGYTDAFEKASEESRQLKTCVVFYNEYDEIFQVCIDCMNEAQREFDEIINRENTKWLIVEKKTLLLR